MAHRSLKRQDVSALAFAAFATLFTSFLQPGEPSLDPVEFDDPALDGLIDAQTASETGGWLLDEHAVRTRLSFAPEYHRLVWRVDGDGESVILDATTGETLGFEFD